MKFNKHEKQSSIKIKNINNNITNMVERIGSIGIPAEDAVVFGGGEKEV